MEQRVTAIKSSDHYKVFLENLILSTPHYVYWKDVNSVYLGCNRNFANLLGLRSPKNIIGKTDFDLGWQADSYTVEFLRQKDQEVINGKAIINLEQIWAPPQGSKITVHINKVPLIDEDGSILGILGVATDITEQKKEQQNLIVAKERAEVTDRIKSDFIRNMEHDIRTPFTGIWGMANVLAEQETDATKKEVLLDIVGCAKELLDYCNGILDFSKIELGYLPALFKKCNLRKLVESVTTMELPAAKMKQLDFAINYASNMPDIVISDRHRLQRILINLLSNAIKFTDKGHVKLTIKLAKQVDPHNIICRIVVEDTGIGIPRDKQDSIYEKFARIMPSNRGVYKGHGLGLRIVKQFIEELNGEIDVKSELGKGTTFICTIPFKIPLIDDIVEEE